MTTSGKFLAVGLVFLLLSAGLYLAKTQPACRRAACPTAQTIGQQVRVMVEASSSKPARKQAGDLLSMTLLVGAGGTGIGAALRKGGGGGGRKRKAA